MGEPLRFAIIGCGKIAGRHAEQASAHGQLVAVCDIIKEKADSLASQYRARPYYSLQSLLAAEKNIDLIAVCTPNWLHAEQSIHCLREGHHVLCEKPLAISKIDAEAMIWHAQENRQKLFVVKSTRYNPSLIELKNLLDEGKAGKPLSFQLNCFWNRPPAYYEGTWRGKIITDGGTLFTQFSHYIDALLWLFGSIKSVNGFRKNQIHAGSIEFEDTGTASVEMDNGMIGGLNWSVNAFQKNMEVSLTILAEKTTLRLAGEYMNQVDYQLGETIKVNPADEGQANDYGFYKGSMSNHHKVYEHLVKALKDDQHPFTSAVDGLKTVEAIELIYNSIPLDK